jgi:hypothetical protein
VKFRLGTRGCVKFRPGTEGIREVSPREKGILEVSPWDRGIREVSPGDRGIREVSPWEKRIREDSLCKSHFFLVQRGTCRFAHTGWGGAGSINFAVRRGTLSEGVQRRCSVRTMLPPYSSRERRPSGTAFRLNGARQCAHEHQNSWYRVGSLFASYSRDAGPEFLTFSWYSFKKMPC